MRIVLLLTLACVLTLSAPGADATAKKQIHPSTKKKSSKPTGKSAAKKSPTARRPTGKTPAKHAKTTGKRKKSKTAAADWRSRQLAPTPERYKEIQTALAQRGYLHAAPSGVWDASSAEALRRFQQDQNLEPNGKLNSLSLIALGLGAKRGNTLAGVPTAPPVTAPRTPSIDSPPALPQNAIPPTLAPNPAVPELPQAGPPPPASR